MRRGEGGREERGGKEREEIERTRTQRWNTGEGRGRREQEKERKRLSACSRITASKSESCVGYGKQSLTSLCHIHPPSAALAQLPSHLQGPAQWPLPPLHPPPHLRRPPPPPSLGLPPHSEGQGEQGSPEGAGGGGCSGAVTLIRLHGKAHTHTNSRWVLDTRNRLQWKEWKVVYSSFHMFCICRCRNTQTKKMAWKETKVESSNSTCIF